MTPTLPTAGELKWPVVIRLWSDVPAGAFGLQQVVDDGMPTRAKVEPIHSLALREGALGLATTEELPTHLFWVRRRAGLTSETVTTAHVVDFKGWRHRVVGAIDVDGVQRFVRIAAKRLSEIPA